MANPAVSAELARQARADRRNKVLAGAFLIGVTIGGIFLLGRGSKGSIVSVSKATRSRNTAGSRLAAVETAKTEQVSGHTRNVPHGPDRALRTEKYIEPYKRSPRQAA